MTRVGCNCGGRVADQETGFIVDLPGGERRGARTEEGARMLVTMAGGGSWRTAPIAEVEPLLAD